MVEETLGIAAALLGVAAVEVIGRLGAPGRRNLILRLQAAGRTVIAKRMLTAPGSAGAADRFAREAAACRALASAADGPHGPALIAEAAAHHLLVVEDFGAAPSLADRLLGEDPAAAEAALLAFATRLGLAHGGTAGLAAAPPARDIWPQPPEAIRDLVERLLPGSALPAAEIALLARRAADPGAWLAWTHRDPCPDNVLLLPDGSARLIDFEHAGMGFALLDAAYAAMAFPTCWCAGDLPQAVILRFEAAYRDALAQRRALAADPALLGTAGTEAAGIWLLARLVWLLPLALEADARWGTATRRARLRHDILAFERLAARHPALPGLRDAARRIGLRLAERWPETGPLPLYPAFAASAARMRESPSR